QLGSDHRRFSVEPEHYNAVGASLLATLRHFLGAAWTDELASDWAEAYGVIAKVMVQGAEESSRHAPSWWNAEVIEVDRRTLDIAVVRIRPEQHFDFTPGQSIAIELPQRPRLWRYYSPANAPREDGTLELHAQIVDGGQVSGAMVKDLKVGDTIKFGAPVGQALTVNDEPGGLLLIAGGTGLAPLRAVVDQFGQQWRSTGSGPKVHLFHGARMPWNLYDHNALKTLSQERWFEYDTAVSDDATYPGTKGNIGRIAASRGSWSGYRALVCGSPGMVDDAVSQLIETGMPREAISYENFGDNGYQPSYDLVRTSDPT
ncbi:MAG: FAD-binding oxidoreductase, partial [Actinomycetia bacterium]|nr:FAD-binding oxidoreductase [Actinomycetes bacterium]